MRVPEGREAASDERSFCAFCTAPLPEDGETCCAEYEAELEEEFGREFEHDAFDEEDEPWDGDASPAPARETPSRAPFVLGSQFLVGLLVSCVSVLALMLMNQARIAEERSRELEATRRLSHEMISWMKEGRRHGPKVVPATLQGAAEGDAGAISREPEDPEAPAETGLASVMGKDTLAEPGEDGSVAAAVMGLEVARADATAPRPTAPLSNDGETVTAAEAPRVAPAAEVESARERRTQDAVKAVETEPAVPSALPAPPASAQAKDPAVAAAPPAGRGRLAAVEPARGGERKESVVPVRVEAVNPVEEAPRRVRGEEATRRPSAVPRTQTEKEAVVDPEPESADAAASPVPPGPSRAELERRLRELASLAFPAERPSAPPPTRVPTVWTKLERGMSRRQVETLLGEPRRVERLLSGEFWLYADRSILGRGWVAFSDRGYVMEWLEP